MNPDLLARLQGILQHPAVHASENPWATVLHHMAQGVGAQQGQQMSGVMGKLQSGIRMAIGAHGALLPAASMGMPVGGVLSGGGYTPPQPMLGGGLLAPQMQENA